MNNDLSHPSVKRTVRGKIIRYVVSMVVISTGLIILFREAHHLKINDFIAYWSASRIIINGGNPYSPSALLRLQQDAGLADEPLHIMLNPPWILPLLIIFGFFSRTDGQMLWVLAQIGLTLYCSSTIWQLYGNRSKRYWVAWLIACTFSPVIAAILFQGQISPFILLGVTGFLIFMERPNGQWLAGVFACLASIKPQIVYLFFIVFIVWIVLYKKWKILGGFLVTFALLNLIALAIDLNVYSQYFQTLQKDAPTAWATPTIGMYLRLAYPPAGFQVQFLPSLLGAIWMVIYWFTHRFAWNWKQEMPLILFISVISAPYIYTYDMVILLIPLLLAFIVIFGGNRPGSIAILVVIYLAIDFIYIWLHLRLDDAKFIWFAPALFLWYLIVQGIQQRSVHLIPVEKSR